MHQFSLHFHPQPDRSSEYGTFSSEAEFNAYKNFEQKHTNQELVTYRLAPPSERAKTAEALLKRRKAVYAMWKQLCKTYLPNGELV
jgi:hypothetical protein